MPDSSFIRVDFPAPFSPTKASTSLWRRSRCTPDSAFTPGKLLLTPSARSRTSVPPIDVIALLHHRSDVCHHLRRVSARPSHFAGAAEFAAVPDHGRACELDAGARVM